MSLPSVPLSSLNGFSNRQLYLPLEAGSLGFGDVVGLVKFDSIHEHPTKRGMVASICNPSTQEVEAGGSNTQARPRLHSGFKVGSYLRNKTKQQQQEFGFV